MNTSTKRAAVRKAIVGELQTSNGQAVEQYEAEPAAEPASGPANTVAENPAADVQAGPVTGDLCGLEIGDCANLSAGLEELVGKCQSKVKAGATLYPLLVKIERLAQAIQKKAG